MESYPTVKGVTVSPFEHAIDSRLNIDDPHNWNNHHHEWTARNFARLSLFQVFRDLERHQFLLPVDVHNDLHRRFDPPVMPTVGEAMNVVMEAYEAGERIRRGSAHSPIYTDISLATILKVKREYNETR